MASKTLRPLTENEIAALVGQQVQHSKSYLENEIAGDRSKNLRYELGEPLGNEVEGHSKVVSTDVADTIQSLMPDIMEIFGSGPPVKYKATQEGQEAFAEEATEYVNSIVWHEDNDGDLITHDWSKDTLVEKNGVLKVYWDDEPEVEEEEHEGVTLSQVTQWELDPRVEVTASEPVEAEEEESEEGIGEEVESGEVVPLMTAALLPEPTYNVTLERTLKEGVCRLDVVPSEEFLITSRDTALDESTQFCAHRTSFTRSYWIERGFDEDAILALPSNDDLMTDRSKRTARARNADQESALTFGSVQQLTMQKVVVNECYMRLDLEGTGESRIYLIWTGGEEGDRLLRDPDTGLVASPVDYHPFVDMTAIRQPHRWAGRAVADLMRSIQEIKSTLQRQALDNTYNVNNQRAAISNKVSLDDWLNNEIGGTVEVDTDAGDVAGHIFVPPAGFIGGGIIQMLEYFDTVGKARSGVSMVQSLDPEALHKTATGANMILGEMHKRMLFMVRMMAKTGFSRAFKKILRVLVDNQTFSRRVQLREDDSYVDVNPQNWPKDFGVKPVVGLGHGTRTDKMAAANAVLERQSQLFQFQGGLKGPFVYPDNVGEALQMFEESLGVGQSGRFFAKPPEEMTAMAKQKGLQEAMQPEQKQPDPEMIKAQQQAELDRWKAEQTAALEQWKAEKHLELEWAKLRAEAGLKQEELANETRLEAAKMATGAPGGQGNIAMGGD